MQEKNVLLEEAIINGDIDTTKELLESGASLPEKYKYVDIEEYKNTHINKYLYTYKINNSGKTPNFMKLRKESKKALTEYAEKKHKDFRSNILSENKNLQEDVVDNLAEMFSVSNQFDYALFKAVHGGFMKSQKIEFDSSTGKESKMTQQTDMLQERRKLVTFIINHYESSEENQLDILKRFQSLKKLESENTKNQEEWNQAENLLNKCISFSKGQTTEIINLPPPVASITIESQSSNSSVVTFDNSVVTFNNSVDHSDGSVSSLKEVNDTLHTKKRHETLKEPVSEVASSKMNNANLQAKRSSEPLIEQSLPDFSGFGLIIEDIDDRKAPSSKNSNDSKTKVWAKTVEEPKTKIKSQSILSKKSSCPTKER